MEINEPFLTKQSCGKKTGLLSIRLLYLKDWFDRLLLYPMDFSARFCANSWWRAMKIVILLSSILWQVYWRVCHPETQFFQHKNICGNAHWALTLRFLIMRSSHQKGKPTEVWSPGQCPSKPLKHLKLYSCHAQNLNSQNLAQLWCALIYDDLYYMHKMVVLSIWSTCAVTIHNSHWVITGCNLRAALKNLWHEWKTNSDRRQQVWGFLGVQINILFIH